MQKLALGLFPEMGGPHQGNRELQAILFLTLAKGYFAEQGLDVTVLDYNGLTDSHHLVADGEIDVTMVGPGFHLFRTWKDQRPPRIVADGGSWAIGRGHGALVARTSLLESGKLREYRDLKGLRLALTSADPPDLDRTLYRAALRRGGLSFDDVELIRFKERMSRMAALAEGRVDVSMDSTVRGPLYGRASRTFDCFKPMAELLTGRPYFVLVFSHDFCVQRPDVARRCVVAYLKGLRDFHNAFEHRIDYDETIELLAATTGIRVPDLRTHWSPQLCNPDGHINSEGMATTAQEFQEDGVLAREFTPHHLIDESFLEAAIAELGPYRTPRISDPRSRTTL